MTHAGKTDANRRALLAKAHIGKKALALDDATWTDLVHRITGFHSSKDASDAQLAALVNELTRLGFKPDSQIARKPGFKKSGRPQVRLVHALWGELGRRGALTSNTKEALRAFCGNQAKRDAPIDPEFLDGAQLRMVIEALKAWVERVVSPKPVKVPR
jgi:phage gp16-like protein